MRLSRWVSHLLVCAASIITVLTGGQARLAHAQEQGAGPATSSEYDSFLAQAVQAYEVGRFAEARSLFRRAHEIQPTARTMRTIGMCSFNLGDYIDALQNLDGSLNETRKPLSAEQRTHVAELITRSQVHVGRFRVRVSPSEAVLSVDGRAPPRLKNGELLLEPGRHELVAEADGYQPSRSTLRVEGGDGTTLEIRLEPLPAGSAPVAAASVPIRELASPASSAAAPAESGSSAQAVLGYVALGLGGAALVTFGVTAGLASAKASALEDDCEARACGPAYHDDVDGYDNLKLVSTVSLIGGLALAGTGAVLLLALPDSRPERATLTPLIGLGSIGLRGQL